MLPLLTVVFLRCAPRLVILACCYVIALSGVALRGSYRADKRWVDIVSHSDASATAAARA